MIGRSYDSRVKWPKRHFHGMVSDSFTVNCLKEVSFSIVSVNELAWNFDVKIDKVFS